MFTKTPHLSKAVHLIGGSLIAGGATAYAGAMLIWIAPGIGMILFGPVGIGVGAWVGSKVYKSSNFSFKASDLSIMESGKILLLPDDGKLPQNASELIERSLRARHTYPQRIIGIFAGGTQGPYPVDQGILDVLYTTGLPAPNTIRSFSHSTSFLEVLVRPFEHLGVGVQLNSGSYNSISYYNDTSSGFYDYSVSQTDMVLFAEYFCHPVNRFYTKRFEYSIGAGLVFMKSSMEFAYRYSGISDFYYKNEIYKPKGLHLRTSVRYYPLARLSIFGGAEFRFADDLKIDSFNFSIPEEGVPYTVPEHSLKQSTGWIKIGFGIHI